MEQWPRPSDEDTAETAEQRRRRRRRQWWRRLTRGSQRLPSPETEMPLRSFPEKNHSRPERFGRRVLRMLGLRRSEQAPRFLTPERGLLGHIRRATRAVLRLVVVTEHRAPPSTGPPLRAAEARLRTQADRLDQEIAAASVPSMPPSPEVRAAPPLAKPLGESSFAHSLPPAPETRPASAHMPEVTAMPAAYWLGRRAQRSSPAAPMSSSTPLGGSVAAPEQPLARKEFTKPGVIALAQQGRLSEVAIPVATVLKMAHEQHDTTRRAADTLQHVRLAENHAPDTEVLSEATLEPPLIPAPPVENQVQSSAETVRSGLRSEAVAMRRRTAEVPRALTERELTDRVERAPGGPPQYSIISPSPFRPTVIGPSAGVTIPPSPVSAPAIQSAPDHRRSHPTLSTAWWSVSIAVALGVGGVLLWLSRF